MFFVINTHSHLGVYLEPGIDPSHYTQSSVRVTAFSQPA